jgi:ABC-type multidrug transport system ATPase subunit
LYFGLAFDAFARLYPDEVSGGELQRITLMILLSRRGDLVLLDEPPVNLDRNLRKRFSDFLNEEILSDKGKTVIMASHDLDFIQSLRLDEAYIRENSSLVRLEAIPRTEGFAKPEAKKAGGTALTLTDVSQEYFKRGIFGERTFKAYSALSIGSTARRSTE